MFVWATAVPAGRALCEARSRPSAVSADPGNVRLSSRRLSMTCPCPLPHRAARNRTRGAPKPHPSNSPARPGKAKRCERAQSVPARPAGRYAEPPAAALPPPSRDENSQNPALQAARCLFLRCSSSSEDRACSFHIAAARPAPTPSPPPTRRRCATPGRPRSRTLETRIRPLQPRFLQLAFALISSRYRCERSTSAQMTARSI